MREFLREKENFMVVGNKRRERGKVLRDKQRSSQAREIFILHFMRYLYEIESHNFKAL